MTGVQTCALPIYQHMGARFEKGAHEFGMGGSGRADGNDIDLAQQFAPVGDGRNAKLRRDLTAGIRARVGDGTQGDVPHALILGRVMMAENPRPDDGGAQGPLLGNQMNIQCPNPYRSCEFTMFSMRARAGTRHS